MSIKLKVLLLVIAVTLTVPLFSFFYLISRQYSLGKKLSEDVDKTFKMLQSTVVRDIRNAMLANQISGVKESMNSMKAFENITRVLLLDHAGKVVIDDKGAFVTKKLRKKSIFLKKPLLQKALQTSQVQLEIINQGAFLHRYLVPFKNEQRCKQCHGSHAKINGFLFIDLRVPNLQKETKHLAILTVAFHGLSVACVSFLLILGIHKIVIHPVLELQTATQNVARGNLNTQVAFSAKDEIGALISYFNQMVHTIKVFQETLQESIKEKERSRFLTEIGMMASKMAHEIRNPLNALEGSAYYLHNTCRSQPDIRQHTELIHENVRRLTNLSADLLSFAKPVDLSKEETNLNALIKEKAEEFLQFKNEKRIRVSLNLSPDLPKLFMDPLKIAQALENILQNAYDASQEGDEVTMTTAYASPNAMIYVRDQGCGIPRRQQENIFQPFFSTKSGGTGLGLCIVKKIVESHGWQIIIESHEGKGTEVQIVLPVPLQLNTTNNIEIL